MCIIMKIMCLDIYDVDDMLGFGFISYLQNVITIHCGIS